MSKPKSLGKGDKSSISGDPNDQGLNMREGIDHRASPRGETSTMTQRPKIKKGSVSSDRGNFKCA